MFGGAHRSGTGRGGHVFTRQASIGDTDMADLSQARVLILATDGFETVELFEPKKALEAAGAKVTLASIKSDPIQGMKGDINKAETITPELTLDDAIPTITTR
jgi:putative intracellular protease/amidase